MKFIKYGLILLLGSIIIFSGLFVLNGLVIAHQEQPVSGVTGHPEKPFGGQADIKILSYNIAKGFLHHGGLNFDEPEVVKRRLQKIADVINAEKPDMVFLSEAVFECALCPLNQVTFLAEATGMHMWAFGENYNLGLPFFRIVGGNAILSRSKLEPVANPSLVGRQPFYVTKNNRRLLWCSADIGSRSVLLGSVHNDSYSRKNNMKQTAQLLDYVGKRPTVIAGDFNANPREASIRLIMNSGRFVTSSERQWTFPAKKPREEIDFVFAPTGWKVTDHKVIQSTASDHLPVVLNFKINGA